MSTWSQGRGMLQGGQRQCVSDKLNPTLISGQKVQTVKWLQTFVQRAWGQVGLQDVRNGFCIHTVCGFQPWQHQRLWNLCNLSYLISKLLFLIEHKCNLTSAQVWNKIRYNTGNTLCCLCTIYSFFHFFCWCKQKKLQKISIPACLFQFKANHQFNLAN